MTGNPDDEDTVDLPPMHANVSYPVQKTAHVRPGTHVVEPLAVNERDPLLALNIDYDNVRRILDAARNLRRIARHWRADPSWEPIRSQLEFARVKLLSIQKDKILEYEQEYLLREIDHFIKV